MADDKISVELVAKIGELTSGLSEASHAMHEAAEAMKESMHGLEEKGKETESLLNEVLKFEWLKQTKEKFEWAFEGVNKAFEMTAGAAEEFGLKTAKFAAMMGTSEQHAAGLAAAVENVGSSTETYESIALRLEQTLEKGTGVSEGLRSQFKDSNGEFLKGADLMERLKTVTDSYAEGSDRTAVTLALLGRRTKDYYDISRVTAEATEHQTEIYKQMGVNFDTLTESSRKLEDAEGDLRTAWKAEQVVIGQELMPVAQAAIEWMGKDGKQLLGALEVGVKGLMSAFAALKTFVVEVVIGITGTLDILWQSIKTGGSILADLATGNFSAIGKDWEKGTHNVAQAWETMGRTSESELADLDKTLDALWDKQAKKAGEAPHPAAGKHITPGLLSGKGKGGGGEAKAEDTEIRDDEKLALAKLAIAEQTNQHELAMGRETEDAFLAQKIAYENDAYAIKRDGVARELEVHGISKAQHQKLLDELELMRVTHEGNITRIEEEGELKRQASAQAAAAGAQASMDAYSKQVAERHKVAMAAMTADVKVAVVPMVEGFKTAFSDMILHAKNFHDAMADMVRSIADHFVNMCLEMGAKWLETQITNALVAQSTTAASATSQISSQAGVAAAGAAASQAGIPFVGPALAVGAAAAMMALVLGFQSLAHAEGGMVLDRDQLVFAHKNEMVLPAHLSQGVQQMISTGGVGGGTGQTTLHYSPTINAPQQKGLEQLLRDESGAMAAWITQAVRDGRLRSG